MVTIYTAPGCGSCKEVKEAVETGNIEVRGAPNDVTLADVTQDEHYSAIDERHIDKIPSAYFEGEKCDILLDDITGKVVVNCPSADDAGYKADELATEALP